MNTETPTLHSPDHFAAKLWAGARLVLARLVDTFGAPVDIAARTPMNARERTHLRHWLDAFESFLRKIVLIEAERLGPPPPTPPRLAARTVSAQKQSTRLYPFKLWVRPRPHPARIRVLGAPTYSRATARERAARDRAERLREANKYGDFRRSSVEERLARRIGAIARVLQSPQTYARRLARRLARMPKLALMLATARPYLSPDIPAPLNQAASSGSRRAAARLNGKRGSDTS